MKEKNFGETIKRVRKEQRLTQKMLSQGICAQSVLSRIENGLEVPNVIVLQKLCQRLNITMEQVLYAQPNDIQRTKGLFRRIHYYFIHQNYQKMEELLAQPILLAGLHLDEDFQLYYYYLGSCEFFLHKALEAAIQSLKKGLSYTYSQVKENISVVEIQILSCLGRVFQHLGNLAEAKYYLGLAYGAIFTLPAEANYFEFSKVFFNYAVFLFQTGRKENALEIAEKGLLWSQQHCSYYYLAELYDLCGQICKKMNLTEKSNEYQGLVQATQKICQNGVYLS